MSDKSQMSSALVDVRKAYRLLYGYHRRIRDIVELCAQIIPEKPFKQLTTVNTLTANKRPLGDWWTWDCTPTFDWIFLFVEPGEAKRKAGMKFMLVLSFVADEALEDAVSEDEEPDGSTLGAVEESRSVVECCMVGSLHKDPAWHQIWSQHWTGGEELISAPMLREDDTESLDIMAYWKRIPMEEFSDEATVKLLVERFRSEALRALTEHATLRT